MLRFETGRSDACLIEVEGVRLAVSRVGAGTPVVCLTATGHGARDFDAFVERLPPGFEAILVDWPGQGRSGEDHAPAGARRYAELLDALLAKLDVERPILLGNSIGGAAAILYAARRPARGLVLCDPGGLVAIDPLVARICRLFVRFFAAGARGAAWFRPAFALYYRMVLPSPAAAAQRRRIVAACHEIAPRCREAWESFGAPDADLRDVAAGLDVPAWFAWAAQDRVIPLARCRPAILAMRQARLTTFRAGHAAFLERPEAFMEGFLDFATGLQATSAAATAAHRPRPAA